MVLCAGYGTRLAPLTDELPKPLVPLGDRSVLAHILAQLSGCEPIVVNTHHRHDAFAALRGIGTVHEPRIRGTAGGLAGAGAALGDGPVLAHNGDIVADFDVAALCAALQEHFAVLAVAPALGEGTVGIADDGRVVRLRGQRFGHETSAVDFIGVQVVSARARVVLPEQGCLVGDVYLPALSRGEPIMAVSAVRSWSDIGTPAAYLEANLQWLERSARDGVHIAPGVTMGGAVTLQRSVIGSACHIAGSGKVSEVVAWPGAHFEAPLSRAIVMSSGRIVTVA